MINIIIEKYYRLKYKLYIMWISLRWIKKVCLGDIVMYKGEEYFISNGVSPMSWTLQQPNFGKRVENAPRGECLKKKTIKNYLKNYNQGYNFYMTNWYGIWVHNREISPWIKALRIWGKES